MFAACTYEEIEAVERKIENKEIVILLFVRATKEDILNELYFVTSFKALSQMLALDEKTLCMHLQSLASQGYIKCLFPDPDSEIEFDASEFAANCASYFFLATKAGLLAHNSR